MMYKKSVLILIFILSVFMITSVSAQENQTEVNLEISDSEIELNEIENPVYDNVQESENSPQNITTNNVGTKEIKFDANVHSQYLEGDDSEIISIETSPSVVNNISVYIDNEKIDAEIYHDEEYEVELSFKNLTYGKHSISFIHPGDETYAPLNKTYDFNITYMLVSIPENNWDYSRFIIYAAGDLDSTITIYANKKLYKKYTVESFLYEIEEGLYIHNDEEIPLYPLGSGVHELEIIYEGNNVTITQSGTYKVTDFHMETYPTSYEDYYVTVYGPNKYSGKLTLKIGSKTYAVKLNSGEASVKIDKKYLKLGNNTITLSYSGDKKYPKYSETAIFEVTPKFELPFDASTIEQEYVFIDVPSSASGKVTLYSVTVNKNHEEIFTKISSTSVKNGMIKVPKKSAGVYSYYVEYTDSKNTYGTDFSTMIKKNTAGFKASVTPVSVKYKNQITVKMKSPINAVGDIYVDGEFKKSITFKKGKTTQVKFIISKPGKHIVKVLYNDYNKKFYSKSFAVTVKKATSYITLNKVNVKKSAKKLVLKATVKKVNGKAVKGKKVTFKFNGKTYKAKTNSKGVAKVTIKKSVLKKLKVNKKVTYSATYAYKVSKTVKVAK